MRRDRHSPVADPPARAGERLRRRLSRLRLIRRGRTPGLRTSKTTLAAVLSFVIAQKLGTSAVPILAPLTALLVVQLTMYETVASGLDRVVSVLAGVLVAVGLASFVGLHWWSLGIVIAASLVLGRLLRLGANLLEVPISAMLVLAVGGSETVAIGRVYETVVGAGVGVLVNVLIAAPLYVQPAGDALAELAEQMAQFLRELAGQLRAGWSRAAADRWLDGARELSSEVSRADRTLARAEDSARFNPRSARVRTAQPLLRTALTGLEQSYLSIRSMCRALLDRTYFVPVEEQTSAYGEEVRAALARLLDAAAAAMARVGAVTSAAESALGGEADLPRADAARAEVEAELAELHRRRDELSAMLLVDPHADQGAWQQHGALLASLDRLRTEVEAAVRPPDHLWRPAPVAERQRQVVRRVLDARAARAAASRSTREDPGTAAPPDP